MKMLIVDDSNINRKMLETILVKHGAVCEHAENGLIAVELFMESKEENKPYSAIFLDIMMPVMDGHEAMEKIRTVEETYFPPNKRRKYTPIIMVTALNDTDNILNAFTEGCDYYLTKPVDKKKVYEILVEINLITEG